MSPWDGASRWINTLLLVVVGFVGFDTLFRLLEANERNVIVGFTRGVATILLSPFVGMFDEQEYLLTALIAVLGYALVAGIAMAVIRSVQASSRRRLEREGDGGDGGHDAAWQRPEGGWQRSSGAWQRPDGTPPPSGHRQSRDDVVDPGHARTGFADGAWGVAAPPPQGDQPHARQAGHPADAAGGGNAEQTRPLPNGQPRGADPQDADGSRRDHSDAGGQ